MLLSWDQDRFGGFAGLKGGLAPVATEGMSARQVFKIYLEAISNVHAQDDRPRTLVGPQHYVTRRKVRTLGSVLLTTSRRSAKIIPACLKRANAIVVEGLIKSNDIGRYCPLGAGQ